LDPKINSILDSTSLKFTTKLCFSSSLTIHRQSLFVGLWITVRNFNNKTKIEQWIVLILCPDVIKIILIKKLSANGVYIFVKKIFVFW